MRRLGRITCAVLSTGMTFGVLIGSFVFLALGTDRGQDLIRRQTEAVVADVLGADLSAQFGDHRLGLAPDQILSAIGAERQKDEAADEDTE
ncbi:MAG: hypothetical protein EOP94_03440, partial [Zymomonas sp.]